MLTKITLALAIAFAVGYAAVILYGSPALAEGKGNHNSGHAAKFAQYCVSQYDDADQSRIYCRA